MKYLTVSEFSQQLKFHMEDTFFHCLVEGEISNVIRAQSGHIYFNLKDESSVVRCVVWRTNAASCQQFIENGAKVETQGKLSLYMPRGDYQLVISRLAPLGRGNLYLAFEQLREKLQKEGLFNLEHKKKIPNYPNRIGILTSPNAAALQDVLKVLKDHRADIPYEIYPSLVQGEEAAIQIVKAIEKANLEQNCDVLLVVRGGGSIEDLWCFNDERVVRAIYASNIPIITGIGHETDTTLSDFVSDLRAPTPTAAAKLSSVSKQEIMQTLDRYEYQLIQIIERLMTLKNKQLEDRMTKLSYLHPAQKIKEKVSFLEVKEQQLKGLIKQIYEKKIVELNHLEQRLNVDLLTRQQKYVSEKLVQMNFLLNQQMNRRFEQVQAALQNKALLLDGLSPLKVLARGYSVTQKVFEDGKTMGIQPDTIEVGDQISTRVKDSEIHSTVISIRKI